MLIINNFEFNDEDYEYKLNLLKTYKKTFEEDLTKNEYSNIIIRIHHNLEYFTLDRKILLEYYILEYKLCLINQALNAGIILDEHYIKYINLQFNKILDYLYNYITKTIEVWFLRELYYMEASLSEVYYRVTESGIIFSYNPMCYENPEDYHLYYNKQEICDYIKNIYYGNSDNLDEQVRCHIQSDFAEVGPTDIDTYDFIRDTYQKCLKMNKRAATNALLNIAHNNGTIADKLMERDKKNGFYSFLLDLSKGTFIKNTNINFTKETGININLLLAVA